MVNYAIDKYGADTSKVFVTGSSSGAMMTVSLSFFHTFPTTIIRRRHANNLSPQNVLAATYPGLFQAAIVYSGVPAGCFVSAAGAVDAWNSTCSQGQSITTPEHWASVVEAMYPGYTGSRPRMQVYHGSTDSTLLPQNYDETMKQWAGVFGYDYENPQSTQANTPLAGYTKTVWGESVQGIYAEGVGHTVPIRGADDMAFFGFAA